MQTIGKEVVSLYFHVPFCKKKCPYCHFYVIPDQARFKGLFLETLKIEWQQKLSLLHGKKILSIYFGGGTPTLLGAEGVSQILSWIKLDTQTDAADCEITIESNPEEASAQLFADLLALGVNRLSIGVQSLDNSLLCTLQRLHTAKKAKEAIVQAFQAGFKNLSIDLMYDLPDQTELSWINTLDQVEDLPIKHISLYNLIIEPHTSFYKKREKLTFPNADNSLKFLEMAIKRFEKIGLKRYEISAFSFPEFQSLHNIGYWTGRQFFGFGPSAFSYWEGERFCNVANLQRYAKCLKNEQSPIDFREKLPYPQNVAELLAVRLRMFEGLNLDRFFTLPEELISVLERYVQRGYLAKNGSMIFLTETGALFYDTLAEDIVVKI